MSEIRACVNCRHIGEQPPEIYNPHAAPMPFGGVVNKGPECKNLKAATMDLVYGKTYCINERNSTKKKACGPQGKLWEPKKSG